ncbi:MAG: 16S rRNA (guanine(527)-N(7))-methyltransferase RsmG [bacterium]
MVEPLSIPVSREDILSKLNNTSRDLVFKDYIELINLYNQKINLVSRRLSKEQIGFIILDSLVPVYLNLVPGNLKILDLGSGSGILGIPMAIARPDLGITLAESNTKKCAFLRKAVSALKIPNITIQNQYFSRQSKVSTNFDFVIIKAVSDLYSMCYKCAPLLVSCGKMIVFKSRFTQKERKFFAKSDCEFDIYKTINYSLNSGQVSKDYILLMLEKK